MNFGSFYRKMIDIPCLPTAMPAFQRHNYQDCDLLLPGWPVSMTDFVTFLRY
jgi:hypothetical protein